MAGALPGIEVYRAPTGAVSLVRLTPERQEIFLRRLELNGNISEASDLAGISRNVAYELRCKDPDFDARCQQALERCTDRLEAKVRARAEDGTTKGVWYKGERVGDEVEHHDNLSIFMLRAHRPDVYRPDVAAQVNVGLSLASSAKMSDAELEAVVARQLKRDNAYDPNTLNRIADVQEVSRVYDNATEQPRTTSSVVQPSATYGKKGPLDSKGGGGRPDARGRKGPKHRQGRASPRRSKTWVDK